MHKVVIAIKIARIVQQLASDAIRQQKDKYALQQQFFLNLFSVTAALQSVQRITVMRSPVR